MANVKDDILHQATKHHKEESAVEGEADEPGKTLFLTCLIAGPELQLPAVY